MAVAARHRDSTLKNDTLLAPAPVGFEDAEPLGCFPPASRPRKLVLSAAHCHP